ncbi:hypothetical protein GQX74_014706 [Glossina fuscipes]|nr:hypothetical protein GQX74_014706 [Glossina fuscipes]
MKSPAKCNGERAYFTREGKYLALTTENLFERRPSLVIGDRVKAAIPWAEGENAERKYVGVIHEVLRNRTLIRFDYNFQQSYNYVDCRLEFYFPRYEFRKQHYAISRAAENLGEQFLFPSRVQTRECPQLDIHLNDEGNLLLHRCRRCEWHNYILNSEQKRAVANILRGEIRNMPHTLVPGARLLVGTPSNSCSDVITTRLIESGVLKMDDLTRLVSHKEIK